MRLFRAAYMELKPPPSHIRRQGIIAASGVHAQIGQIDNATDVTDEAEAVGTFTLAFGQNRRQEPAKLMLEAWMPISVEDLAAQPEIEVPIESHRALAQGLSELANIVGVVGEVAFEVFSPRPYLFLIPENDADRSWLNDFRYIALPNGLGGGVPSLGPGLHRNVNFHLMLEDRAQGVALMAAALAAGHGVAKLHEVMRLFENAFAVAGGRLIDPLTDFLRSHEWSLQYSRGEVRDWIRRLRDPGTHADRTKQVLLDPDVQPHLPRLQQAAYDVLFNKRHWHRSDSARLDRWAFSGMVDRDGRAITTGAGTTLNAYDGWDHYKAFRLEERVRVSDVPEGSLTNDWYRHQDDGELA